MMSSRCRGEWLTTNQWWATGVCRVWRDGGHAHNSTHWQQVHYNWELLWNIREKNFQSMKMFPSISRLLYLPLSLQQPERSLCFKFLTENWKVWGTCAAEPLASHVGHILSLPRNIKEILYTYMKKRHPELWTHFNITKVSLLPRSLLRFHLIPTHRCLKWQGEGRTGRMATLSTLTSPAETQPSC